MTPEEAETRFRMGERNRAFAREILETARCEWCEQIAEDIEFLSGTPLMWVVVDHSGAAYYCNEHVPNEWGCDLVFAAEIGGKILHGEGAKSAARYSSRIRYQNGKTKEHFLSERQQKVLRRTKKEDVRGGLDSVAAESVDSGAG